jgi:hypothetical protein
MNAATACALGIALLVVAINLNYSLLSAAIYRLREQHWPSRLPLGIPLLGSLAVLVAWLGLPEGHGLRSLLLVLALIDTGGPLAWLVARLLHRRPSHQPAAAASAPLPTPAARLRDRTLG